MAQYIGEASASPAAGNIRIADNLLLNAQKQVMRNNQPLFSVGNNAIAGYLSTKMYDQYTSSAVGTGGLPTQTDTHELVKGATLASGQPYLIDELVIAASVVGEVVG